jgi:hypothetical protein
MNTQPPRSQTRFSNRSKRRPNSVRPEQRNSQSARANYERYLALAQAQLQAGDRVGAENYYQHAEHYLRSMSPEPETT